MNLVACPKCGSRFDVSTLQPGSTFVCGSCKNVLQVPRQPVAGAPAAPAKGPAPARPAAPRRAAPGRSVGQVPGRAAVPGKPGPAPRVDPRRAGGATSTQMPATGRQPAGPPAGGRRSGGRAAGGERPSRRGPSRDAPKKSAMPLILGGAGLGLIIVIVIVVLVVSGSKPDVPVLPGGGGGGDQGTVVAGGNQEPSASDQIRALEGELFGADGDLSKVQSVFTRAKAKGFSGTCRKAADYAITIDPNLDWANKEVGNRNLKEVYDRIPTDDILQTYGNKEYETLRWEAEDPETYWGTTEEYEKLEGLLEKVLTHHQKLKNDRLYLDEYVIRKNVEKDPVYKDYPFRVEAKSPYIMFVEHTGEEGRETRESKEAARIVERNLNILSSLYNQFMADFKESFKLPDISELEQPSMRTLKLWTFSSHKSFQKYQKDIGQPLPPGVGAYYRPDNQWITLFEQPGSAEHRPGTSDFNTNKIFHEGLHQLMHVFTKVVMERELGEEVLWSDRRCHSRLHWFQEGMAELYGSAVSREGGKWDLKVPYKMRLGEWWNCRKNKQVEWTFEEIRSIRTGPELQQRSRSKGLTQQGRLSSLFYAQAWSWVYFLYNYENGKYRDKLIEYMAKELKGVSSPEDFAKTWGAGEGYDWGPVEKEWRGFVDKLWADNGFR